MHPHHAIGKPFGWACLVRHKPIVSKEVFCDPRPHSGQMGPKLLRVSADDLIIESLDEALNIIALEVREQFICNAGISFRLFDLLVLFFYGRIPADQLSLPSSAIAKSSLF